MARGDIRFIKAQGASKRTAPGEDYISGLVLYNTAGLPSGFTTTYNTKALYGIVEAENAGIVADYSDETQASGTYAISAVGANGDTIEVKVLETFNNTISLGTYTKVSGDTTTAKVADGIAAAINANTLTTGYSATSLTGTVTIKARKGLGVYLNTGTPISVTIIGTIAGTITQFSGGVASKFAVYHYHIAEYFRLNPKSVLWVGFYPIPSPYTFAEITSLQAVSGGKCRQIGVYKDGAAWTSADLTTIQTEVLTNNDARHKPLSVLYGADLKATADITAVADLALLNDYKVSSIIGQDGYGLGASLFYAYGKSITQLGAALGALSLSAVSEDFANPAKFNISNGYENNVPAFANGQLVSALNDNALDALDLKRHIFSQLYIGYSGTFFQENHCACTATSDYAFINDNRVIDKACRGIYSALIPYLKGKIIFNADGTIQDTTIAFYQSTALDPLYQMSRDGDLSQVSASDVYIDPSQLVKTTGNLQIVVYLNEDGIARNITIPISFK